MGFDQNALFPVTISWGSKGGPGFDTAISAVDSKYEERTSRRAEALHAYDVAYGIKSAADLAAVKTFYYARRGALQGFKYKDWLDFTTASNHVSAHSNADVLIGTGDGSTTVFQMIKKYTDSGSTYTRTITKPISSGALVAVAAVNQVGNWSISESSGLITFTSAPAVGLAITAGCAFYVPLRFSKQMDARIEQTMDSFDNGSFEPITIEEILNEVLVADDLPMRGFKDFGAITANQSITALDGGTLKFSPAGALDINLPDYTALVKGGPWFLLINAGSATLTIKDHTGATVTTIIAGAAKSFYLILDGTGAKVWFAI